MPVRVKRFCSQRVGTREAASDKDLEAVCRQHSISAASFYRWKKQFGGMELKDARKYRELEKENGECKKMQSRQPAQDPGAGGSHRKKRVSPWQKRRAVQGVVEAGPGSQRRACRYLGLHRSSHRDPSKQPSEWLPRLPQQIEMLSRKYPRLGYRKLTRRLRREGWQAGCKLVQRIGRECDLRVKRWRAKGYIENAPTHVLVRELLHRAMEAKEKVDARERKRIQRARVKR